MTMNWWHGLWCTPFASQTNSRRRRFFALTNLNTILFCCCCGGLYYYCRRRRMTGDAAQQEGVDTKNLRLSNNKGVQSLVHCHLRDLSCLKHGSKKHLYGSDDDSSSDHDDTSDSDWSPSPRAFKNCAPTSFASELNTFPCAKGQQQ